MTVTRRTLTASLARLGAALVGLGLMAPGHGASAQTLDRIKQRGVLTVGVNTDYRPFGFLDPSGAIVGMEPDLAKDMADQLHVKLQMVPVQAANRMEFLRQGRIDLVLASLSYNPQRAKVVGMVEPAYYDGGTALLARKSANLRSWGDLRDKPVCGTQGAYYNRPVAEKYGATIVAFATSTEAENALLNGSCVGYVEDSGMLSGVLASGDAKWRDYDLPLPVEDTQPWMAAVPLDERDAAFGRQVSDVIASWHRSGKLIAVSEAWHLPVTEFLKQMHAKYSQQ
jgi:polar amino acid transport system substrate-binding protein